MKEKLSEKHEREWEVYSILHTQSLNDLIEKEIAVRKKFGMREDHLPEVWRDKIERDRQAFTQEWSAKGTQAATLTARQQEEKEKNGLQEQNARADTFSEEEMDAMYADFLAAEKVQEDLLKQQLLEDQLSMIEERQIAGYILSDINNLLAENDAIRNHYEVIEGRDVPHATQQRMAKHLVTLRQQVDGKVPGVPLDKWRTMNDEELAAGEAKSHENLLKQHDIIRLHYGHPENIPDGTKARMAWDEVDYRKELQASQQSTKPEFKENTSGIVSRLDFKEQLKAVRERNEQSVKRPKPG